jgi:hypothetical protein
MSNGIFHLDGNELIPMTEEPYDSENLLQRLLEDHPQLMPGDQIHSEEPRKWLLIKREMGVPSLDGGGNRWSADHLFLDQDAIPTIVEVKRSTDTRIRREVVGQMLDYAANATEYWPAERMREEFERRCLGEESDPEQVILSVREHDEAGYEDFWELAKTNLQAGRVRLLFVADRIPTELRRIIEFLNQQMDPAEVLAVEIKQYVGADMRSLVPRVYGQTAQAEQRKRGARRGRGQWDAENLLADLQQKAGGVAAEVARKLLDWCTSHLGEARWGTGAQNGSFGVGFRHGKDLHLLFRVNKWGRGEVSIPFKRLRKHPPFDDDETRSQFMEQLNEIPNVSIQSPEGMPQFPLVALEEPQALEQFLEVMRGAETAIRQNATTKAVFRQP